MSMLKRLSWLPAAVAIASCGGGGGESVAVEPIVLPEPPEPIEVVGDFTLRTLDEADFFSLATFDESGTATSFYYSNASTLYFDTNGYLVNAPGYIVSLLPVSRDGSVPTISTAAVKPFHLDFDGGESEATSKVELSVNLSPFSNVIEAEFDCEDPNTYNESFEFNVFDSTGAYQPVTVFFRKHSYDSNSWQVHAAINCTIVDPAYTQILDFNEEGNLDIDDEDEDGVASSNNGLFFYNAFQLENGALDLELSIDFGPTGLTVSTSKENSFAVSTLQLDGSTADTINFVSIASNGLVTVNYANQGDVLLGTLLMAKFTSPANLADAITDPNSSDTLWTATETSGEAAYGHSGSGNFGAVAPVIYQN